MLPALRSAIREWWEDKTGPVVRPLDIKGDVGVQQVGFSAASIESYQREGYNKIYAALQGGMPGWSGQPINHETAMNHSVVWCCNRVISEAVGFLPCITMQSVADGKREATNLPVHSLLVNAVNEETTAMGWFETLTSHLLMRGNAYSRIYRRSGTESAREFQILTDSQIRPERTKNGKLTYIVKDSNEQEKTYTVETGKPHDILHVRGLGFDGLTGYSVMSFARNSWGTALSAERYTAQFFRNGGRLPYILEMERAFRQPQDYERFRDDWNKAYANPDSMHLAPILEPGMQYKQIGISAADAQLLETRQLTVAEICRWFLLSPHFVGDLSRATFSNIEHLALDFYKRTLSSWLTRWEQELWRCVLTPEEKSQGYYFRHRVDELLRGDFLTRMQGYASALQNGIFSVNEVRSIEDRNPVDGGNDHHIQLNMQTLPGGTPTRSQQAAAARAAGGARQ